jgi:transposase
LVPRLAEARAGTRAVFFVDAAHFVFGAFVGALGCGAQLWIQAPCGRRRFHVLGALNEVTPEVITVTPTPYLNAESVCQLLHRLAALALSVPIPVGLGNARYPRGALVHAVAEPLPIELLFLPPDSPHLNLMERRWKLVKKQCLYAKYYPDFAAFTTAIDTCLAQTQTMHQPALKSLLTLNFQTFQKLTS